MWRETDSHDDGGGRLSRLRQTLNVRRPPHDGGRGEREPRSDRYFSGSDHADGARHAAALPMPPSATAWQQGDPMMAVYEPPPEPSPWWETLKIIAILGITVGSTLYGVYRLNAYMNDLQKEVPVYGDTAAPPPGRGAGPPSITWGAGAKH
ncbi:MAG: hypothetical protein WCO00_16725 [Rhodospirillaceae bacterium]